MPTFTFTDPNGLKHNVTGPEGATADQAFKILQSQLSATKKQITQPEAPVMQAAPQAALQPAQRPEPTAMDTVNGYAGAAARGLIGAGTGLVDLATTIPYNAAQFVGSKVSDKKPSYIPTITEKVQEAMTKTGVPQAETLGQKAVEVGAGLLGPGGGSKIVKGFLTPSAKRLEGITEGLGSVASTARKTMEEMQLAFHPEVGKQISTGLDQVIRTSGAAEKSPQVSGLINRMKASLDAGELSLENIMDYRASLNQFFGSAENAAATQAKKAIDKVLTSRPKVASGDPKALEMANAFNTTYKQFKQHEHFADVLANSDSAATMRSAASKILQSDELLKSYSPEVQKLIKKASEGTSLGRILDIVGKLKGLLGIKPLGVAGAIEGAAAMAGSGAIGAAPLAGVVGAGVTGALAKAGGKAVQKGLTHDILKAIEQGR